MNPLLIAGISALGNVASSAVSGGVSGVNQRRQYEYNRSLMAYQNELNRENWRLENEYNTPSAQMARFKAAGLNPNLVYTKDASGGSIGNVGSSSVSQAPLPQGLDDIVSGAVNSYMQYRQYLMAKERNDVQNELTRAQTQATQQEALNKAIQSTYYTLRNTDQRLKNQLLSTTLPYQVGAVQEQYVGLMRQNRLRAQQATLNEQQFDIRERAQQIKEQLNYLNWQKLQLERSKFDLSEREYLTRKYQIDAQTRILQKRFNMDVKDWKQFQNLGGSYGKTILPWAQLLVKGFK